MKRNHPSHSYQFYSHGTPQSGDDQRTVKTTPPSTRSTDTPRKVESRPGLTGHRLARVLRQWRQASGKSREQVALDAGTTEAYLWRLENGERQEPSRERLIVIAAAMVLNADQVDDVVNKVNSLLSDAGFKTLPTSWGPARQGRARHPSGSPPLHSPVNLSSDRRSILSLHTTEFREVTREDLILSGMKLALTSDQVPPVLEVVNELLDAGGYKTLPLRAALGDETLTEAGGRRRRSRGNSSSSLG